MVCTKNVYLQASFDTVGCEYAEAFRIRTQTDKFIQIFVLQTLHLTQAEDAAQQPNLLCCSKLQRSVQ